MNTLSFDEPKPYQIRDYVRIQPGPSGSVGEVNVSPRLRHSAPDMPLRFDPYFSFRNAAASGSNVQSGTSRSFMSGGIGPFCLDSNWTNRRRKIRNGWIIQDLRQPDTIHQPSNTGVPQYSWDNKIATAYKALRTGDMFLPTGPYMPHPSDIPRGGAIPRIVDDENQESDSVLKHDPVWDQQFKNYSPQKLSGQVTQSIVKRFE